MGDMGERKVEEDTIEPDKKSKLVAFLLSFFLGEFGADWFYLSQGDFTYLFFGFFKLFLLISPISFCCYNFIVDGCSFQDVRKWPWKNIFCQGSWIIGLVVFIWWVVDWARVLTNTFPDGNGRELLIDF